MSRSDILVFGASGFTGKYAVKQIMKIHNAAEEKFTWGVAGRNSDKLKKTLEEMGEKEKFDVSNVPVVVADVQNEESLNEMAKKAKVLINCCGPFRFYGEAVVKACVANRTHYVDVSGEPQFIERMQLKYNDPARENEVYVISACGYDSVPADLGVVFLKNKFEGQLNSVDIYMEAWFTNGVKFSGVHYGTWESAVYGLAHWNELIELRKALYPTKLPEFRPKQKKRFIIHKSEDINKWCLPFPGADRSVVKRSQRFFYEYEKQRPIQVNNFFAFPNLFYTLLIMILSALFMMMTKFQLGRTLLLKYPKLLSLGFASHEGPTEEQAENTHFSFTFAGNGWEEKLAEPTDEPDTPPRKKMVTRVSGTNPGYGATCIMLVNCALAILKESDKMPNKGGVFPPGAAFSKTKLIENLNKSGVTFEVVQKPEEKKEA